MRYRLRTLLILMAVGPPVLAPAIVAGYRAIESRRERSLDHLEWKLAGPGSRNVFGPVGQGVMEVLDEDDKSNP